MMKRFYLSALVGLAGGCAAGEARIEPSRPTVSYSQPSQEQSIVITSGITLIPTMQESPASWAALQDIYVQLRSFEGAYRTACRAPEMFERIDAPTHRQYQEMTELRHAIHDRLLRVWISHPGGDDRVDTRVMLEWESAAQRRYPFAITPRLVDGLNEARVHFVEVLEDYHRLRGQAGLEGVVLGSR